MKEKIKIVVFSSDSCINKLPENPKEFLAWWQKKFDLVPIEYHNTMKIDCSISMSYGSPIFEVEIYYYTIPI